MIIAILIMEFGKLLFLGCIYQKTANLSGESSIFNLTALILYHIDNYGYGTTALSGIHHTGSVISWFHMELLTEPATEKAIDAINILDLDVLNILEIIYYSVWALYYLSFVIFDCHRTFARKN